MLAVIDDLGIDEELVCAEGGAIGLGHPWGASGTILADPAGVPDAPRRRAEARPRRLRDRRRPGPGHAARTPGALSRVAEIRFTAVHHRFGSRVVLDGIDLTLTERRIGIVGANGSGKSTMARMINGLVTPTSGDRDA